MEHENENEKEGVPSLTEEEMKILAEELELTNRCAILERTRKKNFNILNTILSEYLDSFIILGYTAEGDEVICHKLKSSRDTRSLASLLEEITMSGFVDDASRDVGGDPNP